MFELIVRLDVVNVIELLLKVCVLYENVMYCLILGFVLGFLVQKSLEK